MTDYASYFDDSSGSGSSSSSGSKSSGSNLFNLGSAANYNSDAVKAANQDSLNYTGAAGQQAIAQAGQAGQQQLGLAKDASSFGANQSALAGQQNVQNQINLANSQASRAASANVPGTKSYTWGTTMTTDTALASPAAAGSGSSEPSLGYQLALSDRDRYNQQLIAGQQQQSQQQLAQIQANAQLASAKTQADAQVQSALFGSLGNILGGSGGGDRHQYW